MLEIINENHLSLYRGFDYLPPQKKRILAGKLGTGSTIIKPFAIIGKWNDRVIHCRLLHVKNALELKTPIKGKL